MMNSKPLNKIEEFATRKTYGLHDMKNEDRQSGTINEAQEERLNTLRSSAKIEDAERFKRKEPAIE